ncbi:MAG: aminodeoxychorismate/anthranilate synthase component II [Odoribacter sp.]|nr:aminodeoxychorismate/anthranilate synthase component II [Odoribacter sp.]
MNILLIDNYDSFTYNIAHIVRSHPSANLQIIQSGNVILKDIESFEKIIFSPGPDLPGPGNVMEKVMSDYASKKPILGICLGLQAIVLFYGGKLRQLDEVLHGRVRIISQTGSFSKIFQGLPGQFEAGLYHSWVADPEYMPDSLNITAVSDNGLIMGIHHKTYDIEAVQFHPESIMTPMGIQMINNWIVDSG